MDELNINKFLNLNNTILCKYMQNLEYPWDILKKLEDCILDIKNELDLSLYIIKENNVYIHKTAKVHNYSNIIKNVIIGENSEIRFGAYIRENVVIGNNCVVGNSSEIKNSILFNNAKIPHFNYVGDSILGFNVNMGASSICSNLRLDEKDIIIKIDDKRINTKLKKFGAIIGDNVKIGCGTIINPGSIICKNKLIKPLKLISGFIK